MFRASDSVVICESKKEKQEVRKLSFTNHSFESFWDFYFYFFLGWARG